MTEAELKSFIKVVTQYFSSVTGTAAVMGLPFVKNENDNVFDYTGIIGISGSRRGGLYFTAGKALLEEFSQYILGETAESEENLLDLIGEMINTISGNMRETFGSSFHISVPIVMKGRVDEINMKLKPPVFIIPMEWNSHPCHLAVGLE